MNAKAGSLPLPEIDIEEFRKVVRTRRSIRRFTDEPIPEAVLEDCLELAKSCYRKGPKDIVYNLLHLVQVQP